MENRVIRIIRNRKFTIQLQNILRFIAHDKRSAAIDFQHEIDTKFELLKTQPMMGRMNKRFGFWKSSNGKKNEDTNRTIWNFPIVA